MVLHTTGANNTAVGKDALENSTTSLNNVAVGEGALNAVTTSQDNTAVGRHAGSALTTPNKNTFIGNQAGSTTTTGAQNTVVGSDCTVASATSSNAIVIGYNISGDGDRFMFGKASNRVYNDFISNASWTRSSDERKKTNIADATLGLDFVNDLRTVTFKWKRSQDIPNTLEDYDENANHMDTDITMHGMLAQDVKAALDTAGVTTFGGWAEESDGSQSLSQEMFIYPLIKAIQELSTKNDSLETSNTALAARITALENA
jgi:trimeric autotransporter adhesin